MHQNDFIKLPTYICSFLKGVCAVCPLYCIILRGCEDEVLKWWK